jgi:hypothetical protein
MKLTIKALAVELKTKFQGQSFPACTRHNGRPSDGWSIVGEGAITQAIRLAGLPNHDFWSGMAPTPSTQAPSEIVNYAWVKAYGSAN